MAVRVRPATTVLVMLVISFAFQLIAILTVPVTKSLSLSDYQGLKFGVLGLCSGTSCSKVGIGYSVADIDDVQGFTLPSNARHSISKLLIVHPIAAGFTLVLTFFVVCLHWHGPANSSQFLFIVLLWTIPTFLLCLLSFLVDILLFIPRLSWVGWTILASTVLIALSSMMVCIMRRTASSRKSSSFRRPKNLDDNYYELAPLSYGYGTVDGGSDSKSSFRNSRDNANRANQVYVGADDLTANENNDIPDISNDLISSPLLYDSVKGSHNPSTQSGYTRYTQAISPIAPPADSYRGIYDSYRGDIYNGATEETELSNSEDTENNSSGDTVKIPNSAPYPTELPSFESPPYPTQDSVYPNTAPLPSNPSKPLGPRPLPSNIFEEQVPSTESDRLSSDLEITNPGISEIPEMNQVEVSRAPTFRTKIEQTLNALQPENASISSSDSAAFQKSSLQHDQSTDSIDQNDDFPDLFKPSSPQSSTAPEGVSSVYSSHIPSEIQSAIQESSYSANTGNIYERETSASISTKHQNSLLPLAKNNESDFEDDFDGSNYQLSDPLEKRLTPAPSFTNISTFSSNFTSVSQRGINPKYIERNPNEFETIKEFPAKFETNQYKLNSNSESARISRMLDNSPDFTIERDGTKNRNR